MTRRTMRAMVSGVMTGLFVAGILGVGHAHEGDLHRLLAQGRPQPFVGGQSVKLDGDMEVIHGDGIVAPQSFIRYFVRNLTTHELFELGFDESPSASLITGRRVTVRGRQQNSVIWVKDVAALDAGGATGEGSTVAAPVLSERTAIAILVNLSDATLCADAATCTYTPSYVAGKIFTATQSMRELYLNSSYGQVTFKTDTDGNGQPDVVGPYNISLSKVGCNWSAWGTAADIAAQAAGVNLALYQHRIYILPPYSQLPDCGWAGLAYIGGSKSYIAEPQSMMVYTHELGHNLNMAHAGTDPENDGVMNVEYGDSIGSDGQLAGLAQLQQPASAPDGLAQRLSQCRTDCHDIWVVSTGSYRDDAGRYVAASVTYFQAEHQ